MVDSSNPQAGLDKLANLIASVRQDLAVKENRKAAEARVKSAKSAAQRAAALAEVQAIRDRLDWADTAIVYRVVDWQCACGGHGTTPQGIFLFQEHKRLANAMRLYRPEGALPPLPRRIMRERERVDYCDSCAEFHGFTTLLARQTPVVALPTYYPPLPPEETTPPEEIEDGQDASESDDD